jgi:hypothetical protein
MIFTLYNSLNTEVRKDLIHPSEQISLQSICKMLNVSRPTNKIKNAKLFVIDIMNFVDFIRNIDFAYIDTEIKNRVLSGKSKLVLHHSHETNHKYSNDYFFNLWENTLRTKINDARLPIEKIIYISGDKKIEQSFENDDFNTMSIETLEMVCKNTAEPHKHKIYSKNSFFNNRKRYDFLYLNALPRPHRCVIKYLLEKNNVMDRCIYSWAIGNNEPNIEGIQYFCKKADILEDAKKIYHSSKKEKILDASSEKIDQDDYLYFLKSKWIDRTKFSFVTETDFSPNMLFITEKTLKPIYHGHPFLIFGNNGTLEYLKSKKFETFPELFDESYDNANTACKIQVILNNLKSFKEQTQANTNIVNEKISHNQNTFFNQFNFESTRSKLKQCLDS